MPKLVLVRHGETDWNVEGRFQGTADRPLNENGLAQAERAGKLLKSAEFDHLHVSPLTRTQQTAEAINKHHGLEMQTDDRLRELGFGDWEGFTWKEIEQQFPEHAAAFAQHIGNTPPSAESLPELEMRVQAFIDSLRHSDGTHLIVSHGGTLKTMICLLLGLSALEHWQFNMGNCGITEIQIYDQGAIVNYTNRSAEWSL